MGATGAQKARPKRRVKKNETASKAKPQQSMGCGVLQAQSYQLQKRIAEEAKDVINEAMEDPLLLSHLVGQRDVADFLRRSLVAKVSRDKAFAKSVSAVRPAEVEIEGRRCSSTLPSFRLFMQSADSAGVPSLRRPSVSTWTSSSSEPLLKRRRRLWGKQVARSSGSSHDLDASQGHALQKEAKEAFGLPLELTAMAMSFLDLKTKVVSVLRVSAGAKKALQSAAAWDPLHLDKATGRAFFRLLKQKDPLGCFAAEVCRAKQAFPAGLFEVQHLSTVLMDPEKVEQVQSDTEDESPKPRPLIIPDPLDEVCKRLRYYFRKVTMLRVTNIEDYRMDYRFVTLRSASLEHFGFVELTYLDTTPPTYELQAFRDWAPRAINLQAVAQENRQRIPPTVQYDDRTTISDREALYLQEHLSAYKNGEDFHLIHAFYRTVRSHGVRKRYKAVVAALRRRFPLQFPDAPGPNSPSDLRQPSFG
mmetsp:Transcript_2403/g.4397  ORF Transcript_2403/g.4397 Transcript_2403/m.4397 type:complete len:475 (+) Transcript_2403:117-1541(+)|eukprot:CAMPEP_0197627328 /NCGR_PEP_ID=MMETSP1338-20131121/5967_1 /TAXON_ID=43686 ORGANISM="Pelagodinium beii, Strain RCC1491" /NCGR_SAMPLE_ID=MMETSP1338 /ASSEMBLY_ACC=CAM_ASM_000754 /LENGTH=474 /DNA_ID=CAMNT_0043198021 /DNA_START=96 /DNA_END=1520 /DNA_ORIENTATION=+